MFLWRNKKNNNTFAEEKTLPGAMLFPMLLNIMTFLVHKMDRNQIN